MSADIALQVKKNTEEYQDFLSDLGKWQSEIRNKEQTAQKSSARTWQPPPVRGQSSDQENIDIFQGTQKFVTAKDVEKSTVEKEKGNAQFKKQEYRKAIICYTKAIAFDPENAVLYTNRAMAFLKYQKYNEAAQDCTAALDLEPKNVKALWRRGTAKKHLNDIQGALEDLKMASVIDPTNVTIKQDIESLKPTLVNQQMPTTVIRKKIPIRVISSAPEPKAVTKPTKEEIKVPVEKIKSLVMDNLSIKEAPKSMIEFERDWKSLSKNPQSLYEYSKLVKPSSLPVLLKNSFESEYLVKYADLIQSFYFKNSEFSLAFEILSNLSIVPRFQMNLMFLSRKEKQLLKDIFDELSKHIDSKLLDPLLKKYL